MRISVNKNSLEFKAVLTLVTTVLFLLQENVVTWLQNVCHMITFDETNVNNESCTILHGKSVETTF